MIHKVEPIEGFSGRYALRSRQVDLLIHSTRKIFRHRMEITKPQTLIGALGQMAAGLTHSMTPDRLAKVSASVPKVLIISGGEDILIPHTEGEKLKRHMPEAEYQYWEKAGHGVCGQYKERFNQLLERVFQQGKEAA